MKVRQPILGRNVVIITKDGELKGLKGELGPCELNSEGEEIFPIRCYYSKALLGYFARNEFRIIETRCIVQITAEGSYYNRIARLGPLVISESGQELYTLLLPNRDWIYGYFGVDDFEVL